MDQAGVTPETNAGAPQPGGPMMPPAEMGAMSPSTAFFVGNNSLVRLVNPKTPEVSTIWLVDSKHKTMRPFMSEAAFQNAFEDPASAQSAVVTISTDEMGPGGALNGFKLLSSNHGVQDDGSFRQMDYYPDEVEKRYGKAIDESGENRSLQMLDGLFENMINPPTTPTNSPAPMGMGGPGYDGQGGPGDGNMPVYGADRNTGLEGVMTSNLQNAFATFGANNVGIDPVFINGIKYDADRMAYYIGAMTYGGYTLGDVMNDIRRLELVNKGNQEAGSTILISSELPRSQYTNTTAGVAASSFINANYPQQQKVGNIDPDIFKYTVYNMPEEAFKVLAPILDINSEEFKQKADAIKSAFYDVAMQKLSAENEQDKAIADYNYNQFKKELERTYGLRLSDNVNDAWEQIEGIEANYSQRGIQQSGLKTEAVDDLLRKLRDTNDRTRYEKLSTKEREEAAYYRASASPDQIKQLIAEDQAKGLPQSEWRATKWGLIPSSDILSKLDVNYLKSEYGLSDEEAQRHKDSIVDEYGNYRSTLFGNYQKNMADTQSNKRSFQSNLAMTKSQYDHEKAAREFDGSDPFAGAVDNSVKKNVPAGSTPGYDLKPMSTGAGSSAIQTSGPGVGLTKEQEDQLNTIRTNIGKVTTKISPTPQAPVIPTGINTGGSTGSPTTPTFNFGGDTSSSTGNTTKGVSGSWSQSTPINIQTMPQSTPGTTERNGIWSSVKNTVKGWFS